MHHVPFVSIIASLLLALAALLINAIKQAAALVGAIAAVIFMAMLLGWGR